VPKFEPDPREICSAFHGAGTEIGQKGAFCKGLIDKRQKRQSLSKTLPFYLNVENLVLWARILYIK